LTSNLSTSASNILEIKWSSFQNAQSVPDNPPTSIFFKFLASSMTTVSFPAVGT